MSTMILSTLFCIFKILNFLKKKCKCTALFQNAKQHKSISRSPQYPRKRSRPRPPVTFILRPWWPSLWFQKDKPVCSRLKQCWFSLWTGWFVRMGGKVPLTGSIPVSLPEPADSAGMMQDAGCGMRDAGCRLSWALNCQHAPFKGGRDANPEACSHAVYPDLCLLQSVSTKKRNTLKIEEARLLNSNFL